MKNTYEIFFASDNNYAQHLVVAIASILENSAQEDFFNFYILDSNISEENKNIIKNLSSIKDFYIEFIEVNEDLFKNCPQICERFPRSVYFRYLIPLIKPNLEKVLYLDSDIVILDSLKELWNIDLEDYYCVAVEDLNKNSSKIDAKRLDVESYFNSGVLLINNKKWVEESITDTLFQNTEKLNEENNLIWPDQDVLNYTFKNKVIFANPKYNFQQSGFRKPLISKYSKKQLAEAKENIVILHFSNNYKPWNSNKQNESFEEYWNALKLTNFWDEKQKNKYYELKKGYISLDLFGYNIFRRTLTEYGYELQIMGIKTKIKL